MSQKRKFVIFAAVMKKAYLLFLISILWASFELFGQAEHYDIHPKFTYGPTAKEQQLLPTWYQKTTAGAFPEAPVTALAEFHPMGGVMIAYPLGVPVSLVRELSLITKVKVLVYPASDSNTVKNYFLSNGVNIGNVQYWVINHDSYWTRDYGPWFILDGNDEVAVVDFTYNRPSRPYDDAALVSITNKMGMERYEMPMVHTGGNYMVNGYGTAASTSLILEENPNQTEASLTTMAHNYLGVDEYLITNDPLGDYIAHIDCWGKFLAPDKVLIGQVPANNPRYSEYEIAANLFANATTAWGNHYQVFRVFEPASGYYATPYTNSLILNDHVFVPITGTQWDDDAIAVYEQAMPGYTIVPVMESDYTPWYNTDALHCRTHELADKDMLYIQHFPVFEGVSSCVGQSIRATIKPLSGTSLVEDSVRVFYRINEGEWQSVPMQQVAENEYEAFIQAVYADEVDYYIFAKDQSGRRECHPYIGAADPHHFTMNTVGIEEHGSARVQVDVFPNPVTDRVVVRGEELRSVEVYDSFGRLVTTFAVSGSMPSMDCTNWPAGVYLLNITNAQGQKVQKKVVKVL